MMIRTDERTSMSIWTDVQHRFDDIEPMDPRWGHYTLKSENGERWRALFRMIGGLIEQCGEWNKIVAGWHTDTTANWDAAGWHPANPASIAPRDCPMSIYSLLLIRLQPDPIKLGITSATSCCDGCPMWDDIGDVLQHHDHCESCKAPGLAKDPAYDSNALESLASAMFAMDDAGSFIHGLCEGGEGHGAKSVAGFGLAALAGYGAGYAYRHFGMVLDPPEQK